MFVDSVKLFSELSWSEKDCKEKLSALIAIKAGLYGIKY